MSSSRLPRETAKHLLNKTELFGLVLIGLGVVGGLIINHHLTLVTLVGIGVSWSLLNSLFKEVIYLNSSNYRSPPRLAISVDDPNLPTVTILAPVYREVRVLPALVESVRRQEYPKDKLQVILLIEQDDSETLAVAKRLNLPEYFEIELLEPPPAKMKRGKPRACNRGLELATGKYLVIYDAEDRIEPDQLLKAVGTFMLADPDVACLQARLVFWNANHNWLTRLYWSDYWINFGRTLPGLVKMGLTPPLGGTSNIFITSVLREIGGWDSMNVTEDADVAGALALNGYRSVMISSNTYEEAPIKFWGAGGADRQRRRWLKGYMQTGFVHLRHPFNYARRMGSRNYLAYLFVLFGAPLSMLISPLFWVMTLAYLATRSVLIEQWFPAPLYYIGFVAFLTNILVLFHNVSICHDHGNYRNAVWMIILTPLGWLMTAWSAWAMLFELGNPKKQHLWHKTEHGYMDEDQTLREMEISVAQVD